MMTIVTHYYSIRALLKHVIHVITVCMVGSLLTSSLHSFIHSGEINKDISW